MTEPVHDIHSLSEEVILFTLNREVLLTEAKMMNIDFDKYKLDKELRTLKVQMRQVQPFFLSNLLNNLIKKKLDYLPPKTLVVFIE